jgi:hypothetical protein
MYLCVLGIDFDFVSAIIFLYDFGTVSTLWYPLLFSFHFDKYLKQFSTTLKILDKREHQEYKVSKNTICQSKLNWK